ncbi:hemolysin family protein [Entomobacter blattae]|uniref:Transporter associated domain protein n=1 Tax=Entomobacter blattae TaxID=2762277 RepID=A0A7H1NTG2_9PROT|nr:hemolysin family protein [Entomobacter blattae]QNT79072.1 Transporter associated domain protein [Entomobacter blattae]
MTLPSESSNPPLSLLARLRNYFIHFNDRNTDGGLRHSITKLIQQADSGEAKAESSTPLSEMDQQERALLANVLKLRDITADDVMVPRADIIALPLETSLDQALAFTRQENHSRIPVYEGELDNIVGMLHVKDLIAYIGEKAEFQLKSILRQPLMIAPQIPVLDLLLQMRQKRIHLALVIDEYGGVDGLVTIEDLVETIVGKIDDEHDEPETPMLVERPNNTYDISARMPLSEFEDKFGPILTDEERHSDIDTVGGLVFRIAEHVPAKGEVLTHKSGFVFRVLDADARHIYRVRLKTPTLPIQPENQEPPSADPAP